MALWFILRKIIFLIFVGIIAFYAYPLFISTQEITLQYKSGTIYTTQSALMVTVYVISILTYVFLRLLYKLLARSFFLKDLTAFFKINKNNTTLEQKISTLTQQKQWKKALKLTKKHFNQSTEILNLHLLCLVKLNKQYKFLQIFSQNPTSKGIEYFAILAKKWSSFRQFFIIWFLTKNKHQTNEIFAYIYAQNLFCRGKKQQALKIVEGFLHKKIFKESHTFYLFNKLALAIEKEISGNEDFAGEYVENIENYEKLHEEIPKNS